MTETARTIMAGDLSGAEPFMEEGIEHLMMVKPLTEPRRA